MNFCQKSAHFYEFIEIFANFRSFFDVFFLPISPKSRKFTCQPPFLAQKQGYAPKIKKKPEKTQFPLKFTLSKKTANLPILPHHYLRIETRNHLFAKQKSDYEQNFTPCWKC